MPAQLVRIRDAARRLGMRFLWYTPTQYCRLSPVELELGAKRCNAGEYSLCIEPNGNVLPCQSYYVAAGNILRDPWESIWQGELFRSFRDREQDPQGCGLPEMCWDCPDLPLCGGGCRIDAKPRREQTSRATTVVVQLAEEKTLPSDSSNQKCSNPRAHAAAADSLPRKQVRKEHRTSAANWNFHSTRRTLAHLHLANCSSSFGRVPSAAQRRYILSRVPSGPGMGGQSVREVLRADTNLWYGVVRRPVGAVNETLLPVSRGLTANAAQFGAQGSRAARAARCFSRSFWSFYRTARAVRLRTEWHWPDGTRQMVCRASGPAPRDIQPCACRHLLRLVARKRVGVQ